MTEFQLKRQLQLAWLAGIIDGEGHIDIECYSHNGCYVLILRISMTDEKTIKTCYNLWKCGALHSEIRENNHKKCFIWHIQGKEALYIFKNIFHILITKSMQVDCAIKFMEAKNKKIDLKPYHEHMKILNKRGINTLYKEGLKIRNLTRNIEIAWFAGIIDGEGTIKISFDSRNYIYYLVVSVEMTHENTIISLKNIYNFGSISVRKRELNNKTSFQWTIQGNDAYKILKEIMEHQVTKRDHAWLGIRFQEAKEAGASNEILESFFLEMKELNRRGDYNV